jgi:hypothetical protein
MTLKPPSAPHECVVEKLADYSVEIFSTKPRILFLVWAVRCFTCNGILRYYGQSDQAHARVIRHGQSQGNEVDWGGRF